MTYGESLQTGRLQDENKIIKQLRKKCINSPRRFIYWVVVSLYWDEFSKFKCI